MSTNTKICQSSAEFDLYVFSVLYHLNECKAWIRNQGELGMGRISPLYNLYTPLGSIDYSMVSRGPFLSLRRFISNDPNLDEKGKRRERRLANKIFLLFLGTTRPSLSDDLDQALNMIWSSTPQEYGW